MARVLLLLLACCLTRGAQVIVVYDLSNNDTLSLDVDAVPASVQVEGTRLVSNITQNSIRIDVFEIVHCSNIDAGVEWQAVCQQFEQDDSVISCELDSEYTLDAITNTPDDPLYGQQWNLQAIQVPQLWDQGVFGNPAVRVCTVDTGLDIATTPSDVTANLFNNTAVGANGVAGDIHGAAYSNGVASGNIQDLNGGLSDQTIKSN